MNPSEHLPFDGLVLESARDTSLAIIAEIEMSTAQSKDSIRLVDGRKVGSAGTDQLWSFGVDAEVAPHPDTPGTLLVPQQEPLSAWVWAVGDANLVLGVREDLGDEVGEATLALDADFVLVRLRERIDSLSFAEPADELATELLLGDRGDLENAADGAGAETTALDAEAAQRVAAARALEPGVRFTWGPPGTGKTTVLAMAVAEAVARGDRVLVLAHANAAVDVTTSRIAELLATQTADIDCGTLDGSSLLESGAVLRVGVAGPDLASQHPMVTIEHHLRHLHPELIERRAQLVSQRSATSNRSREDHGDDDVQPGRALRSIRRELSMIDEELHSRAEQLVEDAQVVAATLATATIRNAVWDRHANVVIIDEASMAGLPFVLAFAMRGASTLSLFGDFRQLPPIATSDADLAQDWFARDAFDFAGVVESAEKGEPDRRLTTLRTQFRMGEQVCGVVNHLAYNGMLRTHASARRRGIGLAELEPEAGSEIVIIDMAGAAAVCETERSPGSFSRLNLLSAAATTTVVDVLRAGGCSSIGVISPYRAQIRLLSASIRPDAAVEVATIHRFQGSECDAVVIDLTDGFGQDGPSRLTGKDPELARRLLNVAVSRARGKLVLVLDTEFLQERHPRASPAGKLVGLAEEHGAARLQLDALVRQAPPEARVGWVEPWDLLGDRVTDLASTIEHVEVNLGSAPEPPSWVADLVASASQPEWLAMHGTAASLRSVDGTGVSARLQPAGSSPWAMIGADRFLLGSIEPSAPTAEWNDAAMLRVVRQLLTVEG